MRRGVGTIIKETLAAWHITSHSGCLCNDLAKEMDIIPVQRLQERLEQYTDKMYESIKLWRTTVWISIPQPPKLVIRELIEYAIRKHLEQ